MDITNEIRLALAKLVEDSGSHSTAAERIGVSRQNLSRYLNGKVKTIRTSHWKKIREELKEYSNLPIIRDISCESHFDGTRKERDIEILNLEKELAIRDKDAEIQRLKHEVEVLKLREELRDMRELLRREKESKAGEESGGEEVYANPRQELRREVG